MEKVLKESLYAITTEEGDDHSHEKVAAWFLGPKAENKEVFLELLVKSISEHAKLREEYYPDEKPYIDEEVKQSELYKEMLRILEHKRAELSEKLKHSVPFFSQRYQAHMNWDTLMAGDLGYMTAMLYNQNNVATEASPVTSVLEKEVGEQLCTLLGYENKKSWGHITADGTIANIEAMWAARNLKAYPLAIKEMLLNEFRDYKEILVTVYDGKSKVKLPIIQCTSWQLLNIEITEALELTKTISDTYKIAPDKLGALLKPYLLATKGIAFYAKKYAEFSDLKIFVPATHHYSWPKAATLLGLGQDSVINIPVDEECKMSTEILKQELETCRANHYPVIMVVAVIGSTAEGAVDNLVKINDLKNQISEIGLEFHLHCDAAWGGYLRSMLIEPEQETTFRMAHYVPSLPLSYYAQEQYTSMGLADTITIDPHKAGYIPYAAGALCYKNEQQRHLITFNAAYIHSDADTNMGIYGVEGSKPGATAAAVWLAHETVGLNRFGYGQILGECSYSSKLNYCNWISLTGEIDLSDQGITDQYAFCISPLIQMPDGLKSRDESVESFQNRAEMKAYLTSHIIGKDAKEIAADPRAMMLLQNVGADVLMNAFAVNFSKNGVMNTDYNLMNQLNGKLFEIFSITDDGKQEKKPKLVLMMNTLSSTQYGRSFEHIVKEWDLKVPDVYDFNMLVNTVLQPWPNTVEFINTMMDVFKAGVKQALSDLISGK